MATAGGGGEGGIKSAINGCVPCYSSASDYFYKLQALIIIMYLSLRERTGESGKWVLPKAVYTELMERRVVEGPGRMGKTLNSGSLQIRIQD